MSIKILNDLGTRTLLMGIVNVTPDSFSDGGQLTSPNAALEHASTLIEEGADILDIGGESTRPGAEPVPESEELERVIPVIEAIRSAHPEICISIDTYKAAVAEAALKAGADIVNDVSAFQLDSEMPNVISHAGCPAILMHMPGKPKEMTESHHYDDVVDEVINFFYERLNIATGAGIDIRKLILDPGLGFAKSPEHNVQILARLSEFTRFTLPILIGPSRKLFSEKLRKKRFSERQEDTIAAAVTGILNGAKILRVHDVGATRDAVWVADAVVQRLSSS